jgi:hypothetical protein
MAKFVRRIIDSWKTIKPKVNMNTSSKNEYLLLFRGDEWYKNLSAEELQNCMNTTFAWFDRLSKQGRVKGSQPLVREGRVVSGADGRLVADGPFAESKEAIGGYLLITADSLEEATAIAQKCPNLAYGTKIEVRPIADECPLFKLVREHEAEAQTAATAA